MAALAGVLVGYWLVFVLYPAPGSGFDFSAVGVPVNWPEQYTGLAAHFNKNSNVAWAFDGWFLNLFPRPTPFLFNDGGYATLSFIPTLGTMILGLQAGQWLQAGLPGGALVRWLLTTGIIAIALGLLLHITVVCPIVKRIWTPAWLLFSGGCCFGLLALFYGIIDVAGRRGWAFFLTIIGMNSIAICCLVHLIDQFIINSFTVHLGHGLSRVFGPEFEPLLIGVATLGVFYAILVWMYRKNCLFGCGYQCRIIIPARPSPPEPWPAPPPPPGPEPPCVA